MDTSDIKISGWSPPPPPPCRVLTYKRPNPLPPPQMCLNTGPYLKSQPAPSFAAGAVGAGADYIPTAMNHHGYALPTTPTTSGQQYQHTPTSADRNTSSLCTVCFKDHLGRLALMVLVKSQSSPPSNLSSPSSTRTDSSSTRSTTPISNTPSSGTPAAQDATVERNPPYITIQLYLHSTSSALRNRHGTDYVNQWCRQLQTSTAFQYLRTRLSEQCTASAPQPSIRIEAYEAVPDYKVGVVMLCEADVNSIFAGNHQPCPERTRISRPSRVL